MSIRDLVEQLEETYLNYMVEFGDDYDAYTFIDFIVANIINRKGDVRGLIEFYEGRIASLKMHSGLS